MASMNERLLQQGIIDQDTFKRLEAVNAPATPSPSIALNVSPKATPKINIPVKVEEERATPLTPEEIVTQKGGRIGTATYDVPQQNMPTQQPAMNQMPAMQAATSGVRMMQGALVDKSAQEARLAKEQSDLMQQQQQRIREQQEQMKAERERQQEYLASKRQIVEDKIQEYNERPANISQMFADQSTGGKVLTALSLFLGSAPNSSGQNMAVKTLQGAINSDLDKQVNEIEGARGIYNDLYTELGDKDEARAAAYATMLENMKRELEIQASKYDSDLIKANASYGYGQLQNEIDKTNNQFMANAAKNYNADPSFAEREQIKQFYKQKPGRDDETLIEVDNLFTLLEQGLNTGPIAGRARGVRKLFSERVQSAENSLANIGLGKIAAFAAEAGARAVDSEGERAYLIEALPSMNMSEDVLRKKLIVVKGLAKRRQLLNEKKQEYIDATGSLKGFEKFSPFSNQKQYYNLESGEVMMIPQGTEPPEGFVDIYGLMRK